MLEGTVPAAERGWGLRRCNALAGGKPPPLRRQCCALRGFCSGLSHEQRFQQLIMAVLHHVLSDFPSLISLLRLGGR